MRRAVETATQVCPVEVAVAVLGGTWKLTIVKYLLTGTLRYGQLTRLVPLAPPRTLTRQLRELEDDGIVHREIFAEVPPRVEYSLTDLGTTLTPIVEQLDAWGQRYPT